MLPFRISLIGVVGLLTVGVRGLTQTYCSNENTGAGFSGVLNIYNSNGACFDLCNGKYAFGIVQYQTCWCSNNLPSDQQSLSNCQADCPGYPDEKCGNKDEGTYGYIALPIPSNVIVGTAGAATTTSLTTELAAIVEPSALPSTTEHPVTSIYVVTLSGGIVTQTVTSSPTAKIGDVDSISGASTQGNGPSGGAIAGIVIGTLGGIAAIAMGIFLLLRRKRNTDTDGTDAAGAAAGTKAKPRRNISVLSKTGLLSHHTRPSMTERDVDDPPYGAASNRQSVLLSGTTMYPATPSSPIGSSGGESNRRHSKPLVYDQRLNPSVLFGNEAANGSRVSMQDTQDFSRPLAVTNPDIRASFDSRYSRQ